MNPIEQTPGIPGQQLTTRGPRRVPAVIYARTASGEADIARQVAVCASFAVTNGFDIRGIHIDPCTSGVMPLVERPGFCALVDRCAATRGLSRILVSEPDRIARGFTVDLRPETLLRKLRIVIASGPVSWEVAFDRSDRGRFDRLRMEGGA